MTQLQEPCQNCLLTFSTTKLYTHYAYCIRNVKKCKHNNCNMMVDINFTQQHNDQYHSQKSCKYCKQLFNQNLINQHQKICTLKPILCDFCQQIIPIQKFSQHHQTCGSRTQPCSKCKKNIKLHDKDIHQYICSGNNQKHRPIKIIQQKKEPGISTQKKIIEQNNKKKQRQAQKIPQEFLTEQQAQFQRVLFESMNYK